MGQGIAKEREAGGEGHDHAFSEFRDGLRAVERVEGPHPDADMIGNLGLQDLAHRRLDFSDDDGVERSRTD